VRYFLTTPRIGFRCWESGDAALAIRLWSHPQVVRLVADLDPTEQTALARLAQETRNLATHGIQYWPIFLRVSGEHLGCCGLRPFQENVFEIGAHLFPPFWGQGFALEALQAVIAHAFGTLKVRGLFARHHPHNHGSRRLLEKLGFRYTHDDFMPQTGLNHQSYLLPTDTRLMQEASQQIVLRAEDPGSQEAWPLVEQLDALQISLYPPESLRLAPVDELRRPEATFLVAAINGQIVGCGAMVDRREYAELKRMFVLPASRGLGVGRRILAMLEARATCLGLRSMMLETGVAQPEALGLYERAGFQRRGPYGGYPDDALTVFMEKELGATQM
jgi:[ribosomal protein S5]-alanine N-acetyltransferase